MKLLNKVEASKGMSSAALSLLNPLYLTCTDTDIRGRSFLSKEEENIN